MMTFARTLPLGGIILLVAVALVTSPVRAADTEVKIDNFTFNPQQITIKADTTVVWTNGDDIPHMRGSSNRRRSTPTTSSRSHSQHQEPIRIFVPCIRI
jgi:plastocyanin